MFFDNELVKHYPRGEKVAWTFPFFLPDTIEWFEKWRGIEN
jgi:hypothetical protein